MQWYSAVFFFNKTWLGLTVAFSATVNPQVLRMTQSYNQCYFFWPWISPHDFYMLFNSSMSFIFLGGGTIEMWKFHPNHLLDLAKTLKTLGFFLPGDSHRLSSIWEIVMQIVNSQMQGALGVSSLKALRWAVWPAIFGDWGCSYYIPFLKLTVCPWKWAGPQNLKGWKFFHLKKTTDFQGQNVSFSGFFFLRIIFEGWSHIPSGDKWL